jgi:cell division protein FtsW (lipid II flippase)
MSKLFNSLREGSLLRIVDLPLVISAILLSLLGLVTMNSFLGDSIFFQRQLIWIVLSVCGMFLVSRVDTRIFYRTSVIFSMYLGVVLLLILVLFLEP